jgi:hypothetical protein
MFYLFFVKVSTIPTHIWCDYDISFKEYFTGKDRFFPCGARTAESPAIHGNKIENYAGKVNPTNPFKELSP